MDALLRKSGIRLSEGPLKQLWRYHNLLRQRNVGNELTRLIGFETIVVKHYVDCLIVGNFIRLPSPLVDVGTGPGFPGVPLKIRYPNIEMILAEPRPKRVDFLHEVIREVGLQKTTVFEHRVVSQSFSQPVQGVITRAVEVMDKTLLRTSGSLVVGGQAIFMKGPNCDEEIRTVQERFGEHFELTLDQAYTLPDTTHHRRLVVWTKTSQLPARGYAAADEADSTELN
ncbi:16S rRNA (guanine(527)-N(7))-methyltransferase RsmG [bacterium]|nr:16S rRNA (guanine(527)-N(7))-methyltransferase RsmG [bacterium]